jgi:transcriptional regulator with XRE-family HTH domain/tetratricopeptide (TPR) repeat protein
VTPVQKWSGREARALRDALRMSLRDFAAYLGIGERTVSKWEAAGSGRTPRPVMQQTLDAALERASDEVKARFTLILRQMTVPPGGSAATEDHNAVTEATQRSGLLVLADGEWHDGTTEALAAFMAEEHELTPGTALRLSQEWRIIDPPQVIEMRVGRRVGHRLVHAVTDRTDALRHMDDFLGGGDMHDLVRHELRTTIDMVRGASYTDKVGRSLLAAVGELCHLAGWVASDAGMRHIAERYYLGGVSAAHAARHQPLAANLLSQLAYQVANSGDPREAVLLASAAYKGAEQIATPVARAMLLERVAWANAKLGDAQATKKTLDAVDDAFAASKPENEPAWTYWFDRKEIDIMAGRCLTQLKQPEHAIELLTRAVSEYDSTRVRELALYLSWLAEAHIYADNIEEAATGASRTLQLSAGTTSARSVDRVRVVRKLLTPYHGTSAVDEFEKQAKELLDQ